jgi:hypothetical protein
MDHEKLTEGFTIKTAIKIRHNVKLTLNSAARREGIWRIGGVAPGIIIVNGGES